MAKLEKRCAGCGAPLTFTSTPNFGAGHLKDGGRVCRRCFARIVKVQPSFGLRSRKDHDTASVREILDPGSVQAHQPEQEKEQSAEVYRPSKLLTNHVRGIIFLTAKVFDRCIAQQAKREVVQMLGTVFEDPDEVWLVKKEGPHRVWRYVKLYRQGAMVGVVESVEMQQMSVADWYFMKHDADGPDAGAQATAIDAQRTGHLNYSKLRGDTPESTDPVPICMDALTYGRDPEGALDAAHEAFHRWWAVDGTDREHSHEELLEFNRTRSFVLGVVATVCVWNKEFAIADRLQPEFIYHEGLWQDDRRQVVELYLIHLIFQKEYQRVEAIFGDPDFKKEFLTYYDLYRSVLDPHYEFQSKQGPFLADLNKVNQYCRQTGRKVLFG